MADGTSLQFVTDISTCTPACRTLILVSWSRCVEGKVVIEHDTYHALAVITRVVRYLYADGDRSDEYDTIDGYRRSGWDIGEQETQSGILFLSPIEGCIVSSLDKWVSYPDCSEQETLCCPWPESEDAQRLAHNWEWLDAESTSKYRVKYPTVMNHVNAPQAE